VALANAFLAGVAVESVMTPLDALPAEGKVAGSERLIRGPYGLQPYFTFGEGDILSLGGRIFGALAEYRMPGGAAFTRLMVPYPDADTAAAALARLRANLDPYLKVTGDRPDGFDFVDFQAKKGAVVRSGAVLDIRFNGAQSSRSSNPFLGARAGDETTVAGVRLCWCPPGKFIMGSPPGEPERRPGEDQVEVTLTSGFWMAKFEATQGQWKTTMAQLPGKLTAQLPEGDDLPVGNVNFAEAEAFCRKLTELGRRSGEIPEGWEFRLPTEAQWEYACRAGTTTATSFGDMLSSKQANFKGKPYNGAEPGPSLNRAAKVGSYPANAWGLHDMHGNTFEWCRDWYHFRLPGGSDPDLYAEKESASRNADGGVSRVRRGGCWADDGWACRSAFRLRFEPERRYDHIGFRVVVVRS
jgi:sulfatase modifying factor 1